MFNEIYVGVKEVDYIETKIDELCKRYNNRQGFDYVQQRAIFRSYCNDTLKVFDECFETTLFGITNCKRRIEAYQRKDNVDIAKATCEIVGMLVDLKEIVHSMVAIKDLPSCKKLTELSADEIISKAKNLVKSNIVKAGVGALLLGSKINDVVGITDVRDYYTNRLDELNKEILYKGKQPSPMEQFLLDKFNAEIGYCNLAFFKAGVGVTEELKEWIKIGRKHIYKFENQQLINNGTYNLHM